MGRDVVRGMAADIDPRSPGAELWSGPGGLRSSQGESIGRAPRSTNFGITIGMWDYENSREVRLFAGREHGLASNNGSKANPCLSADILGDWREELIARTADN
jgi:rhamnogalacturonan endolyase